MSFTQEDMILMYNNVHPPITPQDAITNISQIPLDDFVSYAIGSLYNQYGVDGLQGSDAQTLTKLIGSTLEEVEFKRQGELYDNVYWGVEGDDLIAAIHETLIHDIDQDQAYKKAQTIAYQVEQVRKKRLAKRS